MFADELLPTPKGLTEDLMNGYSVFNGKNYFADDWLQIIIIFN